MCLAHRHVSPWPVDRLRRASPYQRNFAGGIGRARLYRAAQPFHGESSFYRNPACNAWFNPFLPFALGALESCLGFGSWDLGFLEAHFEVRIATHCFVPSDLANKNGWSRISAFLSAVNNAIREPCAEASIRSGGPVSPCHKAVGPWVLVATILGSSMAFIDGTVVNVALPALQSALNATVTDVQWVIEAYSLLLSALLLVGGSLGDRYGRRAASAWCGLASGIRSLIMARAVQGFGAALLVPGSLAIISSSFREEDRGRAIGTWSGFSAITAAIGPVLGGWLIEQVSWRAVFFINLPLAIIVVVICYWRVPESSSNEKGRLDWLGAIVIALGLGALVWGLIESTRLGFAHPAIVAALVAGLVLIITFVFLERQSRHPMVPLELFRSRTFTGANLRTLLLYSAFGGTLFFVPLNLIQVQHYSPTAAGAALLPFILILFLLSRWAGGLVQNWGWRQLLDNVFPTHDRSWRWDGRQRCAANYHCYELRCANARRHCFRNQQRRLQSSWFTRDRCTRNRYVVGVQSHSRYEIVRLAFLNPTITRPTTGQTGRGRSTAKHSISRARGIARCDRLFFCGGFPRRHVRRRAVSGRRCHLRLVVN